jgi:urease accessory protein UreF
MPGTITATAITMGTAILIHTTMTIDAAKFLRLQSWFSPAFPIGAFSYSHGLEWAVEERSVTDRASLVAWLEADLRHGSGRTDAMFFAEAWRVSRVPLPLTRNAAHSALSRRRTLVVRRKGSRAGRGHSAPVANAAADNSGPREERCVAASSCPLPSRERADAQRPGEGGHTGNPSDPLPSPELRPHQPMEMDGHILAVAALAGAMRGTAELALESGQQGIAFLAAVCKAWPHPELDRLANLFKEIAIAPVLPVAAGICCGVHEIDLELALPLYMHGSVANLVNAAVRLVPLGQTDGQIALAALEATVLETAREAFEAAPDDIGSAAFMIDLASMRHETQYTRLFRS